MDDVMKEVQAEVKEKTGHELEYTISRIGDITIIELPKVAFVIKKGRLSGMAVKLKKRMMLKAIEGACVMRGYKAKVEIE